MRDKGEYLFTSESVSEGHPDKVADRISDTVLDAFLAADPYARVACETLVTTNRIVLAGDVPSPANPPSGCVFHPRCFHPQKDAACAAIAPPLEEKAPGHWAACIKQPPTAVDWARQQAAGATRPPERYLPLLGQARGAATAP